MNRITWRVLFVLWFAAWIIRTICICQIHGFNLLIGRGTTKWVDKEIWKRNESSEWMVIEGKKLGLNYLR